jgi:hypothetical protein
MTLPYLFLWFVAGAGVGLVNTLLLVHTVRLVRPDARLGSVGLVTAGYLLRYGLTAATLLLAVLQGSEPALAAGFGLWIARWIVVAVGHVASTTRTSLRIWRI